MASYLPPADLITVIQGMSDDDLRRLHHVSRGYISEWNRAFRETQRELERRDAVAMGMDWKIPKDTGHPDDAAQCDGCGGWGCVVCDDKGWLPAGHPQARTCYRPSCDNHLPPSQVWVYCSNACAYEDA